MKKTEDEVLKSILDSEMCFKEDCVYVFPLGGTGVLNAEGEEVCSRVEVKVPKGAYFPMIKSGMYDWVIENLKEDPVKVFKDMGFIEFL